MPAVSWSLRLRRSERLPSWRRALSLVALACGLGTHVLLAADFPGTIVLGRPTDSGIAANLLSTTALSAFLEYGRQTGIYTNQSGVVALAANQPLETELTALQPNTRYYYRMRFKAPAAAAYDASPEYSFMTQRPPGSTFVFCIQGDSHPERLHTEFDPNLYSRTLQTAAADKPDFYLTIGDDFSVDQINQSNPAAVTAAQVTERYALQRPFLGLVGNSASIFLVNGNHEQAARYLLDGTSNNVAVWAQNARNSYYAEPAPDSFYSGNPEQIPFIGLLRDYYAWTWGDALFVTIDPYWGSPTCVDNPFYGGAKRSNIWDITHGDDQYRWLKSTLEQSHAKYKFVFAHHVMGTGRGGVELAGKYEWGGQNTNGTWGFGTNRPSWTYTIHQLLVANHVTIFFQGHDHIWVHQQLDGVTYQTLAEPADPNYSLFNSDAYTTGDKWPNSGYTRVTVAPTGLKVEYVRTYLAADEGPGKTNGEVASTYTLTPALDHASTPFITTQPSAMQTVTDGSPVTLEVVATGDPPLSYEWFKNGSAIAGATNSIFTIASTHATDSGTYAVRITNAAGSALSSAAVVALGTNRLINLSVRSAAGSGEQTLIVGFVVTGVGSMTTLLRGMGPTLASYGVINAVSDPSLHLFNGAGTEVAANDDWAGSASLTANFNAVGAFLPPPNSKDAALCQVIPSGSYSFHVVANTGASGVALAELYDAEAVAGGAKFVNISARTNVGPSEEVLIAGFVITGTAQKTILIRGLGPTLSSYGVIKVLADPQLRLFQGGTIIATNDDWGGAAALKNAAAAVGAVALAADNSKDSALLATLPPGLYSVQVSGVGGTTGIALVELYALP